MFNPVYQMSMRWFEGVVENRFDPIKNGRVQVRVIGLHTDNLQNLPESDLHWMQVGMPTTSASNSGVGETPNLIEGTHVVGFFRDGDSCQDGIIMFTILGIPQESRRTDKGFYDHRTNLGPTVVPGRPSNVEYPKGSGVVITDSARSPYPSRLDEPDLSRLATGINLEKDTTISSKKKSQAVNTNIPKASGGEFAEPAVNYTAKYPYNHVDESESGHVIEIDDTPSQERLHFFHRSGSFIEMLPKGDVIYKSVNSLYQITHATAYSYVGGTQYITVDKGMELYVNASGGSSGLNVKVGSGGNLDVTVDGGDVNITVNGNGNVTVNGDLKQEVTGDYVVEVGGRYKLTATQIDLN
jgi:hypothetical protein